MSTCFLHADHAVLSCSWWTEEARGMEGVKPPPTTRRLVNCQTMKVAQYFIAEGFCHAARPCQTMINWAAGAPSRASRGPCPFSFRVLGPTIIFRTYFWAKEGLLFGY